MGKQERYKNEGKERLEIGNTIGFLGVDDDVVPHKMVKWFNQGILEDKGIFETFVEKNARTYFKWDNFEEDEKVKEALFARFILNVSKHYNVDENGQYYVEGNLFNGRLYVPKSVHNGVVEVIASNYFSRMAMMDYIKGSYASGHKLLRKYRETLLEYDSRQDKILDKYFNGEIEVNELFSKSFIVYSQTVVVIIKTLDGYLYTLRGKNAMGSGQYTVVTGIVDRKNLDELVKAELEEELGIKEDKVKNITGTGYSVVDQVTKERRVVVTGIEYEVEVLLTKKDILEIFEEAADKFENEDIYVTDKGLMELNEYVKGREDVSITMKALLNNRV